ncbi:MAG: hypothetical protein AB7P40_01130 [Chloroflexota bacterium]
MTLRMNPTQSVTEVEAALRQAAETAWGTDALPEMEAAIPTAARALWRISQEPLEPSDVEP